MTDAAKIIAPATRTYSGTRTTPERWATWEPREGDILVCTPPKCGTTWTQTILSMLVNEGRTLPRKVPVLSPWVDADLGVGPEEVAAELASQSGRRVVKTHTPADGFPIWEGVTVIAVYRHPLDAFFSLRKHIANMVGADPDYYMSQPVPQAIRAYLGGGVDIDDFDSDTLATLTEHFAQTVLSLRLPNLKLFHYSDMRRDGHATVVQMAKAAGIEVSAEVIDKIAQDSSFDSMKAKAVEYAPVGGTGFWKADEGFFDSAQSRKWEGKLTDEELDLYRTRLAELVPDEKARNWLENGGVLD